MVLAAEPVGIETMDLALVTVSGNDVYATFSGDQSFRKVVGDATKVLATRPVKARDLSSGGGRVAWLESSLVAEWDGAKVITHGGWGDLTQGLAVTSDQLYWGAVDLDSEGRLYVHDALGTRVLATVGAKRGVADIEVVDDHLIVSVRAWTGQPGSILKVDRASGAAEELLSVMEPGDVSVDSTGRVWFVAESKVYELTDGDKRLVEGAPTPAWKLSATGGLWVGTAKPSGGEVACLPSKRRFDNGPVWSIDRQGSSLWWTTMSMMTMKGRIWHVDEACLSVGQ